MTPPALNANTVIIAVLVAGALYGLLGGQTRIRNLILSTYVGIVLGQNLVHILMPYAAGLSLQLLSLILLALPVLVFALLAKTHGSKGSSVFNLLMGLAAGALLIAAAMFVQPPSATALITNDSLAGLLLNTYGLWIIGLMPLLAVATEVFHRRQVEKAK